MWRQGDLLIQAVGHPPDQLIERRSSVLVEGESTGHRHEIEDPATAKVFAHDEVLFVHVHADHARIVHPEHGPISLKTGWYRVWRQRVYVGDSRSQRVVD
jgi:hypothetical protein